MAEVLAGASQREDVALRPATYVGRGAGVQHRGPAACERCDASFLHIHSQEQQAWQDNEGEGMTRLVREKCDFLVSIPMKGKISSLNASAAAAILLYEAVRQRR